MRTRRASQFMPSRAALARTRTLWLTMSQDHSVRDLAGGLGGVGVYPMGAVRIETDEGPALSFNGTTHGTFGALATLPPVENMAFIARVRSTGTQSGNPGAAFGVYSSGAQNGIGIGFNGNTVGAVWLNSGGAGSAAMAPSVQGRWHTVIVQGNPNSTAGTGMTAWVDGGPAVRGGATVGGAAVAPNEFGMGAQHRSSGFLRWFKGDVLWAAILVGDSANWMTDEIAARMFADDYPYNLRRDKEPPLLVGGGDVPLVAGVGQMVLRGNAPAAAQTHVATAPGGRLALRGNAPAAVQVHKATAPGGRLLLRGAAPAAVQTHKALAPGGLLASRGNSPAATGSGALVAPPGRLAMRGNAPAVVQIHKATAPGGRLVLRGAAPAATQTHKATVRGAALVLRGNSPAAQSSGAVVAAVGRLAMRGGRAVAVQTHKATAPGGRLLLRGNSPAILPGGGLGEICDPRLVVWQDACALTVWQDDYSPIICGTFS